MKAIAPIMQKICLDLEIYPYHIDLMGHVNNAVYIQWMEIGRTKLLEAVGMPIAAILQQRFGPVLVQTNIAYKVPLYLSDRVNLQLWLIELRKASAVMQFQFYNDRQVLVAEGTQKGLFVDLATQRPRRLSSEERALFLPYCESAEAG